MRRRRADGASVGKVLLARRDLTCLLDPVLAERRLQAIDNRAAHSQSGVAKMLAILRMAGPLAGDAESADEADAPVDDGDLAMIAIVQSSQIAEANGMKLADLHAGAFHQHLQTTVHFVTAGGVDQQSHFDAVVGFRGQRLRYVIADIALPPDVRLHVNALAGLGNLVEQRREELVAV